ncbi:hypothetical protein C8R42DRAFT_724380 [Lentinula raphanica]|nr:hypothetical protein C8R42DRAFT_724380 [Lentinula raphanica]
MTLRSTVNTIPEALDSQITSLSHLLANLPSSLPLLLPDSTYHFQLNPEDIKEEGYGYALNRRLELAFQTTSSQTSGHIVLRERGPCFHNLIKVLQTTAQNLTAQDHSFYVEQWIERITAAATKAGATAPSTKQNFVINLTSNDENKSPGHSAPSTAAPTTPFAFMSSTQVSKPCTLFDFGVKQVTREEYDAQQTEFAQTYSKVTDQKVAEEARARAKKKEHELQLNRDRQVRHREKVKNTRGVGQKVKDAVLGYDTGSAAISNLAKTSRPGKNWKDKRNGKNGGATQCRHERMNWYHPFLWVHINSVAPRLNWSPQLIVQTLQARSPELFGSLHCGTVSKWIVKGEKRWTEQTLKNVECRSVLSRSRGVGVLTSYLDVVAEIKEKLQGYRTSGIPISRLVT